jgi:hypothetical protein
MAKVTGTTVSEQVSADDETLSGEGKNPAIPPL